MNMKKTTVTALSVAALAAATTALPAAAADYSKSAGVQLAACGPCGAKKRGCGPCNPCKPRARGCNPCRPCGAKKR
jgi:hypothetical protein